MTQEILQKIQEADMVLVGIGEEFEDNRAKKSLGEDKQAEAILQENPWAVPVWNRCMLENADTRVSLALNKLAECLKDKNYFVVTTLTNEFIWEAGLKKERIVAPCGGFYKKQCPQRCEEGLQKVEEQEIKLLRKGLLEENTLPDLGKCPVCGSSLILNNIYTENYDENGYLEQWQVYTKWLQGTLFRKLCILELGVGMQCPSVIRFPFEKAGFYNQKASFIRVNEYLYQLTEELAERGISVSKNAVDWLCE